MNVSVEENDQVNNNDEEIEETTEQFPRGLRQNSRRLVTLEDIIAELDANSDESEDE